MATLRTLSLVVVAAALLATPADAASSPQQELADRYAPVAAYQEQKEECGPGEPYRPISVDTVLGNPDVKLHEPGKRYPVVEAGPSAADLYGKGKGYYLDFPGDPLSPGCTYEKLGRKWNDDRLPVVYAHIATERDRPGELALQYWFYYVFNDFNNKHESDWEMIQLLFHAPDATAALRTHPYEVAYSQHEGRERASWDDDNLHKEGDHPIVYPAAGSHADYYSSAVWLGRSAQEGFGCDDTSPPSIEIKPTPILVPTSVGSRSDRFAWIGYTGRWGQREASFNNGPTGPQLKEQWREPIRWEESARESSVQIPAIRSFGPSVSDFFCGAVKAGSSLFILAKERPFLALGILGGVVLLVGLVLSRTRWRPVEIEPIESRRSLGQIFRTALRLYRVHRWLFVGIGAVFIPIGVVLAGIEALLFEDLLGLVGLTGENSGDGDGLAVSLGGAGAGIGAAIVVGATSVALSRLARGETPRVREVYRAVGARFWRLLWAVVRVGVTVLVLSLTLIGIPFAIERTVRWAFVPQASLLADRADGPLRTSASLTRRNWWRTFLLTAVMNIPAVVLALTVGIAFLLLVPSAPVYSVELVSSFVFALAYPYVGLATTLLYFDLMLCQTAPGPTLQPAAVS